MVSARLLASVLCLGCGLAVVRSSECDPSNYLCAGRCPSLPPGAPLPQEGICLRDTESQGCVCWFLNPSSHVQTLFQCEAQVNGSVSKITCRPPSHCFPPDRGSPGCLILPHCPCLESRPRSQFDDWVRVRAAVHTKAMAALKEYDGGVVEKVQGDVREFSMKHLLFLIGFVIAPLLCWCLLNFFHDGKCRKKPPLPPEAQPMSTCRNTPADDDANEDAPPTVVVVPTAPPPCDVTPGEAGKCESPPPYDDSMEQGYTGDCGPPPSYDDAIQQDGGDIQRLWQTVFVLPDTPRLDT